ncbi:peptide ligase PGM1-related protein [Kitasatospora sp. NPDC056138]|uniref:preATP grasp domain-containing protein n=1 Tax=Kitasatospora sp. NPDC056138 TaxID=3345724 RepID=UPI0035DFBCB7
MRDRAESAGSADWNGSTDRNDVADEAAVGDTADGSGRYGGSRGGSGERGPLLLFANFVSDVVCGREPAELNLHGMVQSSRKVWLARPGDILVAQFPVSREFRRYVGGLLGMAPESVAVVTTEPDPTLPLAETVEQTPGLTGRLRALVAERPGIELLPIVLDRSTVRLAAELGVPVSGYGNRHPGSGGTGPEAVPESALEAVDRLNTKSGFRETAQKLHIRVPAGRACRDWPDVVVGTRELLERYRQVLVKPARAAGGDGLRILTRADLPDLAQHQDALRNQPEGWVVEEYVPFVRDVSVQMEVGPTGAAVVYCGEMRTRNCSYHGFASPLPEQERGRGRGGENGGETGCGGADGREGGYGRGAGVHRELESAGLALGGHLAECGYRGRFSIDAGVTEDSAVYAVESNVRRTATSTRQAMVRRLAAMSGRTDRAWLADTRTGPHATDLTAVQALLQGTALAYSHQRGEGVVLTVESLVPDTGWHYTAIAADLGRATELERSLHAALDAALGPA